MIRLLQTLNTVWALAVIGVVVATAVLHPATIPLVIAAAVLTCWIVSRVDLGVWLIIALTAVETVGPLDFRLIKPIKLGLTALVGLTLLFHAFEAQGREERCTEDPYKAPFYLLVATGFFATLVATFPLSSSLGLAALCVNVLYYVGVRRSKLLQDNGRLPLKVVIWAAVLTAVLSLGQLTQGYEGILGSAEERVMEAEGKLNTLWPSFERACALFNGPSAAGAFLAVGAVIALMHAQVFRKSRYRYLAIALLCSVGLLATFSRGAILGLLTGTIFSSWAAGFLNKRRLALITLAGCVSFTALFGTDEVKQYLRLGYDLADASPSRFDAWHAASVIIQRNPVFGIGFYQFEELSRGIEGFSTPKHPHNAVLKELVEQGPVGAFAYVLFLFVFLRTATQSLRGARIPENRWILGAIAGSGVALFTQELFDANLTTGGSSISILFASFLALQTSTAAKERNLRVTQANQNGTA